MRLRRRDIEVHLDTRLESAEASLRESQLLKDEALQKIDRVRPRLANPGRGNEELAKTLNEGMQALRTAAEQMEKQLVALKDKEILAEWRRKSAAARADVGTGVESQTEVA